MASHPVTKTIEPALTVFSGAEIRVVSRRCDQKTIFFCA